MKYTVIIETFKAVEVDAPSEDQAIQLVKDQLDSQDPRNNAIVKIAKEVNI